MANSDDRAAPKARRLGWRSYLVVLVCLALGLGAGYAYFTKAEKTYQASATVVVSPTVTGLDPANPGATGEISIETEAEVARSATVAEAASRDLEGQLSTHALLTQASVTFPANSTVMTFTVQAPTAEMARDGANALAQAYLDRRSAQAALLLGGVVSNLDAQLKEAKQDLENLQTLPSSRNVVARTEAAINKISEIEKRLVGLGVGSTDGGEIITVATLPDKPAAPQLPLSLGAGLLAGAGLAIALLVLGTRRRAPATPAAEPTAGRQVRVLASVSGRSIAGVETDDADLRASCREIAAQASEPGPLVLVGGGDPATNTQLGMQLSRSWAAEFGAAVVVLTDSTALDVLPVSTVDRPGVIELFLDRAAPVDCATRLPNSRAVVIGPGNRAHLPQAVSNHRLMQVWTQLDHEFGSVLVSSAEFDSQLGSAAIRTAGRVVGIVHADHRRDRDLGRLLDALDGLSATDRLVGVILIDDGDFASSQPPPPNGLAQLPAPLPDGDAATTGSPTELVPEVHPEVTPDTAPDAALPSELGSRT